jgi:hypothetical protein
LTFLMLIGFGYSFFFSMSTIIYLLMRRHVDSAEIDEVYLEEDDQEGVPGGFPPAAAPSPAPSKPTQALNMVDAPVLRTPAPPPAPSAAAVSVPDSGKGPGGSNPD